MPSRLPLPHPPRWAAVLLVFLGAGLFVRAAAPGFPPGLSAVASRPIYPILVRNEYGPLLRVALDVGKAEPGDVFDRNDICLESISFSLAGTDDLRDIASLALVATGADRQFLQSRSHISFFRRRMETRRDPVGALLLPGIAVTLPADLPLSAGENVFWLCARLKDSANPAHRLAAACARIDTTAGSIVPPDPSPGIRARIGYALRRGDDDGVDTYVNPALTATARGTLLCSYDARWNYPGHDLQDHITIGLSRSTDGGRSWEPMRDIMDMGGYGGLPPEQNGCSDSGIIADRQTGEIFVFAVWMHGRPGHHQWLGNGSEPGFEIGKSPQFMMVRSRDDGRTWSKPENLTRLLKHPEWWLLTTSPQAGIQLADGRLVMPIEGRDENGSEFATVMTSADHGAHWTVRTPIPHVDECQAAQLADGRLMINLRNEREDSLFYRAVFVSRDLGRTWKPHPTDGDTLIEPNCNASLIRADFQEGGAKKSVLLFSNPLTRIRRDRIHHTVQVSFDDGLTWPRKNRLELDEGLGEGYSSMVQIDPGHIGIAYAGSQADLTFQILPLAELTRP